MLNLRDYWMGRDVTHAREMTPELYTNAAYLLSVVNKLLALAVVDGVQLDAHPHTGTPVSSGWRPAEINAATPGASRGSPHITGEGIDIFDPEGDLDEWCWANQHQLARLGLYLEHPSHTKGWCHLQTRVPRSQRALPENARRHWFMP